MGLDNFNSAKWVLCERETPTHLRAHTDVRWTLYKFSHVRSTNSGHA